MISKEKFVGYIDFIQELRERENAFNEGLSACFGECNTSDIFVYSFVESKIIEMLCDLMGIEYNMDDLFGDLIQYYIYELDFGKKGRDCIEYWHKPGKRFTVDLTSSEELYDYILQERKQND